MVKINQRWKIAEDINLLRGTSAWTKIKYFWRKGWIEIPVIMGCSFLFVAGTSMGAFTLYYGLTHDLTPKYYETAKKRGKSVDARSKEKIEDLYRSLTFRTVHVSDPVSQLFLRQRFVYVPEVSRTRMMKKMFKSVLLNCTILYCYRETIILFL
ncbi:hypothetical protein ALC56_09570 [Trachymyrmex septentrionalis]|uniref:Transmembrane protein n=1 Tax=Trachymyrmex septentrionalis TaxID=34720 RepID=A0A195F7J1_9HYME|nr:hypothetical protein ALC56_09570 [Trachymyrmex septentrionalis]